MFWTISRPSSKTQISQVDPFLAAFMSTTTRCEAALTASVGSAFATKLRLHMAQFLDKAEFIKVQFGQDKESTALSHMLPHTSQEIVLGGLTKVHTEH